ncbi:McrBC 5-methylcytosine restriction system component-domain-containing protein [Paraphysoderma sedebokerense]|nr:McrBC 5-methylcytosine restriction system component-domain-containing protein [Paraphysoderma sedebokerense]
MSEQTEEPFIFTEYQEQEFPLHDKILVYLARLQQEVGHIKIKYAAGVGGSKAKVNPGPMVGMVEFGRITIEFKPKMGERNLRYFRNYSLPQSGFGQPDIFHNEMNSIITDFAETFLLHAENIVRYRQGLASADTRRYCVTGRIAGTLLINEQLIEFAQNNHSPLFHQMVVTRQFDIVENRILLHTLGFLQSALTLTNKVSANGTLKRRVTQLLNHPHFKVVKPMTSDEKRSLSRYQGRCLGKDYESALQSAKVVLECVYSVADGEHRLPIPGYLLNMNNMFEKFVVELCKRQVIDGVIERCLLQREKYERDFGNGKIIKVNPDVLVHLKSKNLVIVDAKYKNKKSTPDINQMCKFLLGHNSKVGIIVYPFKKNDVGWESRTIGKCGAVIDFFYANLEEDISMVSDISAKLMDLSKNYRIPYIGVVDLPDGSSMILNSPNFAVASPRVFSSTVRADLITIHNIPATSADTIYRQAERQRSIPESVLGSVINHVSSALDKPELQELTLAELNQFIEDENSDPDTRRREIVENVIYRLYVLLTLLATSIESSLTEDELPRLKQHHNLFKSGPTFANSDIQLHSQEMTTESSHADDSSGELNQTVIIGHEDKYHHRQLLLHGVTGFQVYWYNIESNKEETLVNGNANNAQARKRKRNGSDGE